jgi:hypothetical protein
MTNINFDEPSVGDVNRDNSVALQVTTRGIASWGIIVEVLDENPVSPVGGSGILVKTIRIGGNGIWGKSMNEKGSAGVVGISHVEQAPGVEGQAFHKLAGPCVLGAATNSVGVQGLCVGETGTGVFAEARNGGIGILARVTTEHVQGRGLAGRFEGDVEVTGDIRLVNADCAEDFDVAEESVEAGTVMVLTENGSLQSSYQEYDKKVAGIVSGAGGYKPALVLARQDQEQQERLEKKKNKDRLPIDLMGKIYCKVDVRHSSIEIGDLLTTSSTKDYAMKVENPMKAFGSVIGKALYSIKDGLGMIPVLVALQ